MPPAVAQEAGLGEPAAGEPEGLDPEGVPLPLPGGADEEPAVVLELELVLEEDALVWLALEDELVPSELDEEGDCEEDGCSEEPPVPEPGSRPPAVPGTEGTLSDPELDWGLELGVVLLGVPAAFGAIVDE